MDSNVLVLHDFHFNIASTRRVPRAQCSTPVTLSYLQCIYNHIKVPESKKRVRRFNTAYWTYDDDVEMTDNLAEGFNKVKPLIRKKRPTAQKLTIQTTSATPNR